MILAAGDPDAPEGRAALEELCTAYWYPLYAYARRKGSSEDDASETTQAFFTTLLETNLVAKADQERGRFRAFLFTSFKHFLANERRAERAQKRGGGTHRFSIDALEAERRYAVEPIDDLTPERIFERRWALTLIDRTLSELRAEYVAKNKGELFERLEPCLVGGQVDRYATLADELGLSVSNIKISAHRLRQRFQQRLRQTVADTADGAEVGGELRHLATTVDALC